MPEDILVVEYEPRYTDRVRQALAGQPFAPLFARDGEEALRALEGHGPKLIVLSSVIPRISTSELIRLIRSKPLYASTPILITVSGYAGKSPVADAVRMGASDILPKPYTEADFLAKVQLMTGAAGATAAIPSPPAAVRPVAADSQNGLTSNQIFGDLVDGEKTIVTEQRKPSKPSEDLDKMLAETLSGVRVPPPRKKTVDTGTVPVEAAPVEPPAPPRPAAPPPPAPVAAPVAAPAPAPPRPMQTVAIPNPVAPKPAAPPPPPQVPRPAPARSSSAELDKLLENTLSGLEKTARTRVPDSPRVAPAPAPRPEKVTASAPILPPQQARAEEPDDLPGIKFGQYALLEKIATGGMAEVWKARMRGVEGFQKIVAIKKILPHLSDNEEFITMFVDEAKLAAQLNHNNITHIYDLGKIANSYYIAMEYIDGHDLKTILKRAEERGQPMPLEIAVFVASKIAAALDYAHRKRDFDEKEMELVHRDVSPQNVLISHEGDIKLCDFGIAKAASKASHTQAGALKGKLQYMSPEQAWGRRIDRRSDIFALASVLFEMLCARKLFTGDSEISILEQVREARTATPSEFNDEVTPEIDAIVLKALQKNPEARYQTAGEMARDLDAVLYSMRPTPTSADLAIYMHRLQTAEPLSATHSMPFPEEEPEDDAFSIKPVALPPRTAAAAPVPVIPATVVSAPIPPPPNPAVFSTPISEPPVAKKLPVVPIAIGVVLVAGLAIGGYMATRKSAAPATPKPVTTATSTTTVAPATTTTPALDTTATAIAATTTNVAANDQSLVDEEVRRRLEAERKKMEQAQRDQQAADRASGETPAPAPTRAPERAEPVAPPVQQPAASAPEPVRVAENPTPPPSRPAEPAASPAAERVREGDLVAVGTPGLIAPELLQQFTPRYPPAAKSARVNGVVIVSALISESGKVIEAKILRGNGLLNEAALEAVRKSTFRAATKDGVRVKAYKTLSVPFKL